MATESVDRTKLDQLKRVDPYTFAQDRLRNITTASEIIGVNTDSGEIREQILLDGDALVIYAKGLMAGQRRLAISKTIADKEIIFEQKMDEEKRRQNGLEMKVKIDGQDEPAIAMSIELNDANIITDMWLVDNTNPEKIIAGRISLDDNDEQQRMLDVHGPEYFERIAAFNNQVLLIGVKKMAEYLLGWHV
jgi:hypothetical protein